MATRLFFLQSQIKHFFQSREFKQNLTKYSVTDSNCPCEDECTTNLFDLIRDTVRIDPDVECRDDGYFKSLQKKSKQSSASTESTRLYCNYCSSVGEPFPNGGVPRAGVS